MAVARTKTELSRNIHVVCHVIVAVVVSARFFFVFFGVFRRQHHMRAFILYAQQTVLSTWKILVCVPASKYICGFVRLVWCGGLNNKLGTDKVSLAACSFFFNKPRFNLKYINKIYLHIINCISSFCRNRISILSGWWYGGVVCLYVV